jgi:hypothetical protein
MNYSFTLAIAYRLAALSLTFNPPGCRLAELLNLAGRMRGKRKLRQVDAMSTETEQVYECDLCAWLLRVPAHVAFDEIKVQFDEHDCKENSLKKRPSRQALQ